MANPMLKKDIPLLRAPSKADIIPSVLLFLSSRAAVMGVFPFGAAFFAACFDKSAAYLGITILYLGLLSAGAVGAAVKYMMAALIFWLFINLYKRRSRMVESIACGGAMFLSGMAAMFYSFTGAYDIFMLFIESVITGVMYAVFAGANEVALRYKNPYAVTQEELLSVAAAAGVFILGLGRTELPYGISVANIITVYTVLIAALNSSISGAALAGLTLGFITGGSNAVAMMGAFGLSAMFGCFLKSLGRFGTAIGFLGGACAVLLYAQTGESIPYSVWDVLIGAALFAATPGFVQRKFGAFFGAERMTEEVKDGERLRAYVTERLHRCADSFRSLESTFVAASEGRARMAAPQPEDIFSETAGRICRDCARCGKCWEKETDKTVKGMSELLDILEHKGGLSLNAMPLSFRERCLRPERLIVEFEHVYELFKLRLSQMGERYAGRDVAAEQYRETAELLEGISKDLEEDFAFCSDLEEETVRALEQLGILVYEISISEGARAEAYLRLSDKNRIGEVEGVLSDILGINMGFDRDENGGMYFVSRPRFSVDAGVKQLSKEESCGDTVRIFGTEQYKLYCILCDGMGTGERAASESSITAGLLQEFLESGFSIRTAVGMVNSSMCMKAEDDYFTTLDLLCIDLMNGSAEFYKIGAAQSMIYRRGKIETVFSAAFPIGAAPFTEVLPQMKRIEDGDVLVMASDGITEAGEIRTEWLKNQIKMPFLSMQSMAEEITARALEKNNGEIVDDMSVITLKITEN